jgi:hypothetical protein
MIVGRDREQYNLFTMPDYEDRDLERDTITKMTSILMRYLLKEWQTRPKDKDGYLVIDNLQTIADYLHIKPQILKLYLIRAGGYTYPVVTTISRDKKNKKKTIELGHTTLFDIKIQCRVNEDFEPDNNFLVGTSYTHFVKNSPVIAVKVKPCDIAIRNIGDNKDIIGLGNIFATEQAISVGLEMSDMAYKLFTLTSSNTPRFKRRWEILISELGITQKDISKQGRPRILKQITKAFEELKKLGHIEQWEHNVSKNMFVWTYSDKYFKHKDRQKEQERPTTYTEAKEVKDDK